MKHFLADGLSLRMLMDVGVLWAKRGRALEAERIAAFLEQRRYGRTLQVFLHILEEYCGFDNLAEGWDEHFRDAEEAVLWDMESGGVRGFKTGDRNNRKDGLRIYNSELQKKQTGLLQRFYANNQELIRLVFPPMSMMKEKYPWLKNAGILYPAAWLHRLVIRGGHHVRARDVELKNWKFAVEEEKLQASSGTARAAMFRKLDLM